MEIKLTATARNGKRYNFVKPKSLEELRDAVYNITYGFYASEGDVVIGEIIDSEEGVCYRSENLIREGSEGLLNYDLECLYEMFENR